MYIYIVHRCRYNKYHDKYPHKFCSSELLVLSIPPRPALLSGIYVPCGEKDVRGGPGNYVSTSHFVLVVDM
jgi:hypothetical protein